ncbi:MAG: MarR family winged helix-turn-helix transcriptional regulator [Sphingomonadales bacterium]
MTEKPNEIFELANFLPYQLSTIANLVSRELAQIYQEEFDLSVAEWRIIAVLGPDKQLSARDITDITIMDKVTVSRAVQRLMQSGRIASKADKNDRRRQILVLTEAGQDVFHTVVPLALGYEARLLNRIGDEERATLSKIFKKLNGG